MTFCIQCALEAFVAGKSFDKVREASMFDELPEEHRVRVHPDLRAAMERRRVLNKLAAERMGGTFVDPELN